MDNATKKEEHFEGPFSCLPLTTKLLTWLLEDIKDKNSEWFSIVNNVAKKELGWKLDCFKNVKISEKHLLSEEEILKLREEQDESLVVVSAPDLRYSCSNPACKYHSNIDESIKMKVCTRCGDCFYCSADCQRSHWRIHKHECTP